MKKRVNKKLKATLDNPCNKSALQIGIKLCHIKMH
jgi:hypothetical protein